MSPRILASTGLLVALVLIAAFAGGDGVRSEAAGARSPKVGDVVFTDTVSRPAKDCGARRQVRAFQNRLRPRRNAPARASVVGSSQNGLQARHGGCSPPRRAAAR